MSFSFSCVVCREAVGRARFILSEARFILLFPNVKKRNYFHQKKKNSTVGSCVKFLCGANLPDKFRAMNYSKKTEGESSRCLECGDEIVYGRKDRKFCCDECRHKHHNDSHRSARRYRRMVNSILDKNYAILEELVGAGVESIWVAEAIALGYNPAYVTLYRKHGRRSICHCYDISYVTTDNRITSISKIQNLSVTLRDIGKGQCNQGK